MLGPGEYAYEALLDNAKLFSKVVVLIYALTINQYKNILIIPLFLPAFQIYRLLNFAHMGEVKWNFIVSVIFSF